MQLRPAPASSSATHRAERSAFTAEADDAGGEMPARNSLAATRLPDIPMSYHQVTDALPDIPDAFRQVTEAPPNIPDTFHEVTEAIL